VKTFGKYAKERLKRLGKSQKALAERLDVSPAYISQIFTGKKNPPDLGRPRNRGDLKTWSEFLEISEDEILDLVRFELHRVPPRPNPRFRMMREVLLAHLSANDRNLVEEIRSMELHPAESKVIQAMVQIHAVLRDEWGEGTAHGTTRFREFCVQARNDKDFVDGTLVSFFGEILFSWDWDPDSNEIRIMSESAEILNAVDKIRMLLSNGPGFTYSRTIPVVGHVSAGEGVEYTDGGYSPGEGFEHVPLPPGVEPSLARLLYCVRVRGDSLRELFSDGALLFIKPESWEEIRDGDLVIFKDRRQGRAFVKKVEFSGENLILKSKNPLYKDLVLHKNDLMLLERVMCVVF